MECYLFGNSISVHLILRCVTFYYVGCRLFTAGIKQLIDPEFTMNEIFHITEKNAVKLVREIGFANIAFGVAGMAVLFNPSFLHGAALSSGLYFGLAGLAHIRSMKTNKEEMFPMITDLLAFVMIEGCLIISFVWLP